MSNTTGTTSSTNPKKLTVSLAYSGLIYLPLYVAQELGLFSEEGLEVDLVLAEGDRDALRQIMHSLDQKGVQKDLGSKQPVFSDIAICDPFSISDFISEKNKADTYGEPKDVRIIGCLIDKSPIWIYRDYVEPITSEIANKNTDVLRTTQVEFEKIEKIFCYESPNTGYLYGIDLASKALQNNRKSINLSKLDFQPTHEQIHETNTLILTANITKVAVDLYEKFKGNSYIPKVIYTYSTGHIDDGFKDFFFTGILTNTDSIKDKEKIDSINKFLRALRKAILITKSNSFNDEQRRAIHTFIKIKIREYQHIKSRNYNDCDLDAVCKYILETSKQCGFYCDTLFINPDTYYKSFKKRKEFFPNQEELSYWKYVDTSFVYEISKGEIGLLKKVRIFFYRTVERIIGQNIIVIHDFLKRYYITPYSNAWVVFIMALILLVPYFVTRGKVGIEYLLTGSLGIAISGYIAFALVRSYVNFSGNKKIKEFSSVLITIITAIYVSAVGGKLISNMFSQKTPSQPASKTNIIIKKDTIKVDSTKTIIIKVE
jgi:hypothetical protein